jgi:uncharacterized protein (DUF433 family)
MRQCWRLQCPASRQTCHNGEAVATKRIIQDPRILVGKPIIKGTRISVELVLERLSYGHTVEEILDDYPQVKREDILACLDYARAVLAQEIVPAPWTAYSLPI